MATQVLSFNNHKLYSQWIHQESESETLVDEEKLTLFKRSKKMRETSIQMMLRLSSKYNFKRDTLFLAIHILDLLIESRFKDPLEDPEMLGGVLILLTTKYNEVYPVVIDQVNLSVTKYYPREAFYELEGSILEAINFEIPDSTLYSRLYNKLELVNCKKSNSDSDKENCSHSSNSDTDCSEKDEEPDGKDLATKTLEIIQEPECFKHGREILFDALLSYFGK